MNSHMCFIIIGSEINTGHGEKQSCPSTAPDVLMFMKTFSKRTLVPERCSKQFT